MTFKTSLISLSAKRYFELTRASVFSLNFASDSFIVLITAAFLLFVLRSRRVRRDISAEKSSPKNLRRKIPVEKSSPRNLRRKIPADAERKKIISHKINLDNKFVIKLLIFLK